MKFVYEKKTSDNRAVFVCLAAVLALTIVLGTSCAADGGDDDDDVPKLEYVGKVCDPSVSADFMCVSYDGLIFVEEMSFSASGNGGIIHVYSVNGEDRGTFKNAAGEDIPASSFFIDNSNLVNVVDTGFWSDKTYSRYRTDGTLYDQISLPTDSGIPITHDSITLLSNGSVAICCLGTNYIESMSLEAVNLDLEVEHSLTGAQLVAMIPGFADVGAETSNGYMTGMGAGENGEIHISVEFYDGDRDGVLVLNDDFTKKRYVGGDWDFNGPFDVATDGNGYHYVPNMYNDNLKALNGSWDIVAKSDPDDSESAILESPSLVCVRGDYVYVYDGAIHRFKTVKDCPDESVEADPEKLNGGGSGGGDEDNDPPSISNISLQEYYSHDADGNFMGGYCIYTATASDQNGDDITYEWELIETNIGHATILASGSTATVNLDSFGSGYVLLTVTDEHGAEASYPGDNFGQ